MVASRATLRAVVALVLIVQGGCGPRGGAPATTTGPGARLYASACLACHQQNGAGVRGMQPPLAGTPVVVGDPAELLRWVMFGVRPATLPQGRYAGVMPQFGYLGDRDLALLLTFVRSSFGNHAAAITPAMVAVVRAGHGSG